MGGQVGTMIADSMELGQWLDGMLLAIGAILLIFGFLCYSERPVLEKKAAPPRHWLVVWLAMISTGLCGAATFGLAVAILPYGPAGSVGIAMNCIVVATHGWTVVAPVDVVEACALSLRERAFYADVTADAVIVLATLFVLHAFLFANFAAATPTRAGGPVRGWRTAVLAAPLLALAMAGAGYAVWSDRVGAVAKGAPDAVAERTVARLLEKRKIDETRASQALDFVSRYTERRPDFAREAIVLAYLGMRMPARGTLEFKARPDPVQPIGLSGF